MDKFSGQTTNSNLFNNNNETQIPSWMDGISNINATKKNINLEFDKKGAFALSTTINRDELNSTPREMVASFNSDKFIMDAKIELSKFLIGKYYTVTASANSNNVNLEAVIDGLQVKFNFPYQFSQGKLIQANTFFANESEYPFSKAGLDECLADAKNGTLKKTSEKLASSQSYVINREEIIRRYNGHLRTATDSINQKVADGLIVGVGSNCYATFYNPDELFPQLQKAIPHLETGAFEYVNNKEHVETKEYKSSKNLALEADKFFGSTFGDYQINHATRNNNILNVNASIISNGIRRSLDFNFNVANEKIASIKSITENNKFVNLNDLKIPKNNIVNQYLKTASATNKINQKYVLSSTNIFNKLSSFIDKNTINNIINGWKSVGLVNQIDQFSFASKYSFEELLNKIDCNTMSKEEMNKVQKMKQYFGEGQDLNRINQKDTGVREADEIELNNEIKLNIVNNELSKKLANYQINSFKNNIIGLTLFNNGTRNSLQIKVDFNGRKLKSINALIKGKEVSLDKLSENFKKNPLLIAYLANNKANNFSTNIVASKKHIINRLNELISNSEEVFNDWKNKYLKQISADLYTSKYSFEELLNKSSNGKLLTDDEQQQILLAKQYFGEGQNLNRINQKDTGIREAESIELNNEIKLNIINNELSKKLANYQINSFKDNKINISLSNDGVRHSLQLISNFNGRKLKSINALIKGKEVSLDKLSESFKKSTILTAYLANNKANNITSNIVASKKHIVEILSQIISNPNEVFNDWKNKYLKQINADLYTSKYSFEELLNKANGKLLTAEEKSKVQKMKQYFGEGLDLNRINQKDTGNRDIEVYVTDDTLLYEINNFLSNLFTEFNILKLSQDNDKCDCVINLFDDETGLSNDVNLVFDVKNGRPVNCMAKINNNLIKIENVKKAFAMNEALSKYLKSVSGKKVKSSMIITKQDLFRRLTKITNADKNELNNVLNNWKKLGKIKQLSMNVYASDNSLEQLISMSNIKPLSDKEIVEKLLKSRRNKLMMLSANYINDNDTRRPEEVWTLQNVVLHAKAAINSMFADFDILDAELDNSNYLITARIINPVNGLKQTLKFTFSTLNGKKLGEITNISNGKKSVESKNILDLLQSDNEAVNKFVKLNSVSNKNYKNIISKSNLKEKLLTLINANQYQQIENILVKHSVLQPIDNFNFASKFSFSDLIEYLSNMNQLNLKEADKEISTYNKDKNVDTNVKHIKETDTRKLELKEEKLSPKLISAQSNINSILTTAKNKKQITENKFTQLNDLLLKVKNGNDIENIWRELKKYL